MPPFIVLTVATVAAALLARVAYREAKRINAELEEARLSRVTERARGDANTTLRYDPETGTYRPD